MSFCDDQPCLNNANCINLLGDFFCACPSGTDGKRCETAPDRCIGNPCMNNGKTLGHFLLSLSLSLSLALPSSKLVLIIHP